MDYSIKDNSEVVHTMRDHERTLRIEYDDINMKTNPSKLEGLMINRFSILH